METTQITNEDTNLGRFAVAEHNKKENARLQFVRVVKVTKQVVAGTEYTITVEAIDDNSNKQYVAKVLVSMGLKELLEFNKAAPKA